MQMDYHAMSTRALTLMRQSMVRWLGYGQIKPPGFDEQLEAIEAELSKRGCV